MEEGNIIEAYETLIALDGYKDSAEKANSIYDKYKSEKLKVANVGEYLCFGAYEQDNNTSNGEEDIEWLVLDEKDGKKLVISRYALDCQPYNRENEDVTWQTCTLRQWLNSNFLESAFSEEEQGMIPTVTVTADKNPEYNTNPGSDTQDKVFLLSIPEVNKYFGFDKERQCEATAYAKEQGAYVADNGNSWWWLRSPGDDQDDAACVDYGGGVCEVGRILYIDSFDVRPDLWIDLNP